MYASNEDYRTRVVEVQGRKSPGKTMVVVVVVVVVVWWMEFVIPSQSSNNLFR